MTRISHRRLTVLAAVLAAAVTIAVAAGAVTQFRSDDKQTPCEAAVTIVNDIREQSPATVGAAEQNGSGYGSMLRGLITGDYEDVEGKASPEVAEHLRRVADDLAVAEAAPEDEFTTGRTGQDMDALVAACENEN